MFRLLFVVTLKDVLGMKIGWIQLVLFPNCVVLNINGLYPEIVVTLF